MKNIALVDDHALLRQAMSAMLQQSEIGLVLHEFATGTDILRALQDQRFDLVLLDINLGEENGLDVLKQIKEQHPSQPVIMLTANVSEYTLQQAIALGANGFISKESAGFNLKEVLQFSADGEFYIDPALAKLATAVLVKGGKGKLSEREIEVIQLLAQGLGYKEIGEKLFISARTVEAHKNNILQKLELKTVVELVRYALKNHIIE